MQAGEELVGTILASPDYRVRARNLRAHGDDLDPQHVDGFLRQAGAVIRTDPAQARQCARLGLYVARHLGDTGRTVRCLRALSQAASLLGRYPEALRAVDGALELLRPEGARRERAQLSAIRVQVLTQLERWPEAREVGLRVLEIFEQLEDAGGLVRTHLALADLEIQLDHPREALRHFRQAEWLLPEDSSPRIRGALAANRANALQACNRFRAAERWLRKARAIFADEGCEHTLAQMDYNLAHAAVRRGRFAEALCRYDEVMPVFVRLRDDMHRAHIDLDRAEVHILMNLPDDARGYADRAAARFDQLGLTRDRAQADYFAGRAAALSGELQTAADRYAAAREGFAGLGMRGREVTCLVQHAYVALRMDRPGPASRLADEAGSLIDAFANPLTRASVDLLRANLDLAAKQPAQALTLTHEVLAGTRRVFAPWLHVEAYRVHAGALLGLERRDEAIGALRAAIEILERNRGGVPPDEYMAAWFDARAGIYIDLVELLLARGDVTSAYEYALRAKSRALLDRMHAPDRMPTDREDIHDAKIQVLRESLNAVYWALLRTAGNSDEESIDSRSAAHERAERLETELNALLRRRRLRDGAAAPACGTPSAAEVQSALRPDTVLVEYLQAPDAVIAFTVTRAAIQASRTAVGASELAEKIQRFRFHLAKHERPTLMGEDLVMRATRDNLQQLQNWLVDPIEQHLVGARLVIAPHGRLHGLPFHALPWQSGWLCEAFEVLYVPSAAVGARCAAHGGTATGAPAVFAVPDEHNPQIAVEAQALANRLGTEHLYLGETATLLNLRERAADARILHLATHGMFRRRTPGLSALGLSDGWISHFDLETMHVGAELVVLSTCESGVAGVTRGDEILGIARGFLHAGARALLCSQWRVRDDVAAMFMDAFYAALGDGGDAAAAHRRAMARVRSRHPHPYYWAPFFLMGAPGRAQTHEPTMEGPAR